MELRWVAQKVGGQNFVGGKEWKKREIQGNTTKPNDQTPQKGLQQKPQTMGGS